MLKSAPGGDPMLDTASVVAGSSVCALLLLFIYSKMQKKTA